MKRLIVLSFVICNLPFLARPVMAEEVQTCTQVTQYGGAVGIVCGVHTPVETGLADINPILLAGVTHY